MKERFLESFAILLAGLFSAERPRPWQLGDAAPPREGISEANQETRERTAKSRDN